MEEVFKYLAAWIYLGVSYLLQVVAALLGKLALWATDLLTKIIVYNEFITFPTVGIGWSLLRDIANMFFVVVLLMIAIATILRLESYSLKRLLPKLLLMAILVNFSKTICGLLIDAAQVVTLTFANAVVDVTAGNLYVKFGIGDLFTVSQLAFKQGANEGAAQLFNLFLSLILATLLIGIALAVIVAYLVVFFFRMVALWILVILSPLAYVLAAFPQGERYSREWWSTFSKYVVVGPILMFFFWLAIATTDTAMSGLFSRVKSGGLDVQSTSYEELRVGLARAGEPQNLLRFLVMTCLMLGGLVAAQRAGVVGSQFAGSMLSNMRQYGQRLMRAGGRVGTTPGRWGYAAGKWMAGAAAGGIGRRYSEFISSRQSPYWQLLNPRGVIRGWEERRKELHDQAQKKSALGGEEFWDRVMTGGKVRVPRRKQYEYSLEAQFGKDYKFMNKEEMAEIAHQLSLGNSRSPEIRRRKRAIVQAAAEKGYLDDLMSHPETKKKYGAVNPESGNFEIYSQRRLNRYLGDFIGDHPEGRRLVARLEDEAPGVRHPEYAGLGTFDEETVDYRSTNVDDQPMPVAGREPVPAHEGQDIAITEFTKWAGRAKLGAHIHGLTSLEVTPDGRLVSGSSRDPFYRQVQKAVFAGQTFGAMKEHTTDRVVRMLMGGSPKAAQFDAQGRLPLTAPQLETLAHIDTINPDAIAAFWTKLGGKGSTQMAPTGAMEHARFVVNGREMSIEDIRREAPAILGTGPLPGGAAPPPGGGPAPGPGGAPAPGGVNPRAPLVGYEPALQAKSAAAVQQFEFAGLSDEQARRAYEAEHAGEIAAGTMYSADEMARNDAEARAQAAAAPAARGVGGVSGVERRSASGYTEEDIRENPHLGSVSVSMDFSTRGMQQRYGVKANERAGVFDEKTAADKQQKDRAAELLAEDYGADLRSRAVDFDRKIAAGKLGKDVGAVTEEDLKQVSDLDRQKAYQEQANEAQLYAERRDAFKQQLAAQLGKPVGKLTEEEMSAAGAPTWEGLHQWETDRRYADRVVAHLADQEFNDKKNKAPVAQEAITDQDGKTVGYRRTKGRVMQEVKVDEQGNAIAGSASYQYHDEKTEALQRTGAMRYMYTEPGIAERQQLFEGVLKQAKTISLHNSSARGRGIAGRLEERRHEVGHSYASQLNDEQRQAFRATLKDSVQQEIFDRMGAEEYLAETMGRNRGRTALSDASRKFLDELEVKDPITDEQRKGARYYGRRKPPAGEPEPDAAVEHEREMGGRAVTREELQQIAAQRAQQPLVAAEKLMTAEGGRQDQHLQELTAADRTIAATEIKVREGEQKVEPLQRRRAELLRERDEHYQRGTEAQARFEQTGNQVDQALAVQERDLARSAEAKVAPEVEQLDVRIAASREANVRPWQKALDGAKQRRMQIAARGTTEAQEFSVAIGALIDQMPDDELKTFGSSVEGKLAGSVERRVRAVQGQRQEQRQADEAARPENVLARAQGDLSGSQEELERMLDERMELVGSRDKKIVDMKPGELKGTIGEHYQLRAEAAQSGDRAEAGRQERLVQAAERDLNRLDEKIAKQREEVKQREAAASRLAPQQPALSSAGKSFVAARQQFAKQKEDNRDTVEVTEGAVAEKKQALAGTQQQLGEHVRKRDAADRALQEANAKARQAARDGRLDEQQAHLKVAEERAADFQTESQAVGESQGKIRQQQFDLKVAESKYQQALADAGKSAETFAQTLAQLAPKLSDQDLELVLGNTQNVLDFQNEKARQHTERGETNAANAAAARAQESQQVRDQLRVEQDRRRVTLAPKIAARELKIAETHQQEVDRSLPVVVSDLQNKRRGFEREQAKAKANLAKYETQTKAAVGKPNRARWEKVTAAASAERANLARLAGSISAVDADVAERQAESTRAAEAVAAAEQKLQQAQEAKTRGVAAPPPAWTAPRPIAASPAGTGVPPTTPPPTAAAADARPRPSTPPPGGAAAGASAAAKKLADMTDAELEKEYEVRRVIYTKAKHRSAPPPAGVSAAEHQQQAADRLDEAVSEREQRKQGGRPTVAPAPAVARAAMPGTTAEPAEPGRPPAPRPAPAGEPSPHRAEPGAAPAPEEKLAAMGSSGELDEHIRKTAGLKELDPKSFNDALQNMQLLLSGIDQTLQEIASATQGEKPEDATKQESLEGFRAAVREAFQELNLAHAFQKKPETYDRQREMELQLKRVNEYLRRGSERKPSGGEVTEGSPPEIDSDDFIPSEGS